MAVERFTTEGAQRPFDRFREVVGATHGAWDMPRPRSPTFAARVRHRRLGRLEVIGCRTDACRGRRGARELARGPGERLGALFVLEGEERLGHAGGEVFVRPGQLVLWDAARPLSFEVPRRLRKLTLMLPAEAFEPRWRTDAVGVPQDATRGCGALVRAQLEALLSLPGELDDAAARAASESLLGLLHAALGRGRAGGSGGLVARAEALIRSRLDDPSLSVEGAAAALGISRRQLDRAFAASGRSTARFLWGERLEACRRDLRAQPGARVSEVAFRWGFSDAAHFSRAFRRAYGVTPTAWRAALRRARP
ncbi:MAG: helix-turn-helix domain-containing protein [Myxococcota bacterium]